MPDVTGKLGHDQPFDTEEAFLAAYRATNYPRPSVTVDLAIFTIFRGDLKVLLIQRGGHPYRGAWALPGGFVDVGEGTGKDQGEDLEEAAHRELEEETNLPRGSCYLEQLYTFGKAGRDPRTRVISVAYLALVRPALQELTVAGDDASDAGWFSLSEVGAGLPLAFDHAQILQKAVDRLRGKVDYSTIAFDLVGESFTVKELRQVYEAVKGRTYDEKNFYRRFRRMCDDGIIVRVPEKRTTSTRHAACYAFKSR